MTPARLWLLLASLATILSIPFVARAGATVQTSISAEKVEVGQEVRLRIQGDSAGGTLENPRLGVPPSFVVSGPSVGTQQQVTIVGGTMHRSIGTTATWLLKPTKTGVFEIGPGSFDDAGQRVSGAVARLEVVSEGTLPRPARRRSRFPFDDDPFPGFGRRGSIFDDLFPTRPQELTPPAPPEYQVSSAKDPSAFLRATLEPMTAVVGQQLTLRVYAYGALGAFAESSAREPRHPDFFAVPITANGMKQRHYAVDVGDRRYLALLVREIALFPLRVGKLNIGPMSMSFYGQSYARGNQPEGLERSTESISVEVLEPPREGRPSGYQLGDVGDFSLQAEVSPRQVDAGGAVSVVATLKGLGRLPAALVTPERRGIDWLEPTLRDDVGVDPRGVVGGSRTFTYLVRLTQPGQVDLGTLTLPYYSASTGRYQVLRSGLGSVEVRPAVAKEEPLPEAKQDLLDQLSPRERLSEPRVTRTPLAEQAWFYPTLLLPPALVLLLRAAGSALVSVRRRKSALDNDPLELSKEALGLASRSLADGAATEALTALERALFLAVEARTGIKGRAVLLDDLQRVLLRGGLDEALARNVTGLLVECQEARFGSGTAPAGDLLARTRRCVKQLGRSSRHRAPN